MNVGGKEERGSGKGSVRARAWVERLIGGTALASLLLAMPASAGPVILGGDDLTDHGSVGNGQNLRGWLYIQKAVASVLNTPGNVTRLNNDGSIAALGATQSSSTCCDAGAAIGSAAGVLGKTVRYYEGAAAINQFFTDLAASNVNPAMLYVTGTGAANNLDFSEGAALTSHAADISSFVSSGGGLMAHGSGSVAYGWLSALVPGLTESFACNAAGATLTGAGTAAFPGLSNSDIDSNAGPCHSTFEGDLGGLTVLAFDGNGRRLIIGGGGGTSFEPEICTDGIDNDGDGLIDGNDPDCQIGCCDLFSPPGACQSLSRAQCQTHNGAFCAECVCTQSGCQVPQVCGNGVREGTEQCDDFNTTDGDCCSSTCGFEVAGSSCNTDGTLCTTEQCDGAGQCQFVANVACPDDANGCNGPEACDPQTGGCVSGPGLADGTPCNDGDACTAGETCQSGACQAQPLAGGTPVIGALLFASGGNVEVEVLPASAGFTSELHLFSPGPDRLIASNRDVGTVVGLGSFPAGTELVFGIVVRDTGDTFKMGPGSRNSDGIEHAAVQAVGPGVANVGFEDLFGGGDRDYDDNMFQFRGGVSPVVCDDGDPCTDDSCNSVTGCVYTPNTGAACTDGNPCTTTDTCSAGTCIGGPAVDCGDGDACTDDVCNPASGCVHTPVVCSDGNVCTSDTCNPASGCAFPPAPGTSCDDGVYCNGADTCDGAGACQSAGNPCSETQCNHCQEAARTCFDPAGLACNDNDQGTLYDACNGAGACVGRVFTGDYALLHWPGDSPFDVAARIDRIGAVDGNVCADTVRVNRSGLIGGDTVAMESVGEAMRFGLLTQVASSLVTGGGSINGAANVQVTGVTATDGINPELDECNAGSYRATDRRRQWLTLPVTPGMTLGTVRVRPNGSETIAVGAGQVVISASEIRVGSHGTLTISGAPSTQQVIVRVSGKLRVRRGAHVVLSGLTPGQVVFLVGSSARIGGKGQVAGTVLAAGLLRVGSGAAVEGQLLSNTKLDIGRSATVTLNPFVGW